MLNLRHYLHECMAENHMQQSSSINFVKYGPVL